MALWNPSKTVYQCKKCGFRWRSLSLLWSWSYHCPWCGKLQPTEFLAAEWPELERLGEVSNEPPDQDDDESDEIPTVPGRKTPAPEDK